MAMAERDLTNPPVQGPRPKLRRAPQLLTVGDAAIRLSVSTKSIRRWIEAGELPAVRLGRAVRIEEAAAADFVARRESLVLPAPRDQNGDDGSRAGSCGAAVRRVQQTGNGGWVDLLVRKRSAPSCRFDGGPNGI